MAAGFAAVLALATTATDARAAAIRSIRSSAGADYTRVVVDVTSAMSFNYGIVKADPARKLPARLFVDLVGVKLDSKRNYDLWVGDARVKRVRAGQFTSSKARIVLELEGPVEPTVFALQTPARVVIDVRGRGAGVNPPVVVARNTQPTTPVAKAPAREPQALKSPQPVAPKKATAKIPLPKPPEAKPVSAKPLPAKPVETKSPPAAQPVAKKPARLTPPRPVVAKPSARTTASSRRAGGGARRLRIVLDPGHGGKDPGAKGYQGALEKHTVLDVAKRVAEKLRRGLDADVYLTRQSDVYVSLEERKDLANRVEADLFVSIHANASNNKRLRGIETYYLKNSNDRATLRLATLENGVDMLIGGDVSTDADLSYILSDMVQGQKETDSILAAKYIQDELVGYLSPRYHSVESLGVKQGPFLVLDGTYMPSVLVEAGFITHSVEGRRLVAESYRDAIAAGVYRGIRRYFEDDRTAQLR